MALYTLVKEQKIPGSLQEAWNFISSPENLKKITPNYMGFDIVTKNLPEKIYPGIIIVYDVKPFRGIKIRWITEITHVKEGEYFVDEQRSGPYKFWHHQHHIKPIEGGVFMTDIVHYQPPFGFIGNLANAVVIRRQLKEIFDFRTKKIEELFGKF
jgi:ligand-binding SRPBCC domain-containing protein